MQSMSPVMPEAIAPSVVAPSPIDLVAAFARQDNGYVLLRERRDEVEWHARRMRDRFVFVPHQSWQRVEEVSIVDDDFVCLGADRRRHLAGVIQLAERPLLERH